ncbi:MAPEG family protein [Aquabacterium soli]|uniref:MAPEG family protein n=1 Tax=Aquabacterium soli TaxID=2493092 RepID=A0A3R8S735_9BURK|nr:MAPEG family protein [Aquabacterium soli]RRS02989.1 MAPEG family protein [Aquabacterium soli]
MTPALLQPMAVLALWTLSVLLLVPIARFKAGARGEVDFDDFKHGESARVPVHTRVPNRVFMNLLEVPVLFYVACLVAVILQHVTPTQIALAWAYVALRVLHSLIYLGFNKVPLRLTVFAVSNVVVAVMWVLLLAPLWRG